MVHLAEPLVVEVDEEVIPDRLNDDDDNVVEVTQVDEEIHRGLG